LPLPPFLPKERPSYWGCGHLFKQVALRGHLGTPHAARSGRKGKTTIARLSWTGMLREALKILIQSAA